MEANTPPSQPQPSSNKPKAGWWIGAVIVALALGVGGYFIGKSKGESSEKDKYAQGGEQYKEIYSDGFQAGLAKGEESGKKAGAKAGAKAGQEQGEEAGQKAGFEKGEASGAAQGAKDGASQALGGFSDWDTGAPYVVQFGKGPSDDVPFTVTRRTQMETDTNYTLCEASTTTLCTSAKSP